MKKYILLLMLFNLTAFSQTFQSPSDELIARNFNGGQRTEATLQLIATAMSTTTVRRIILDGGVWTLTNSVAMPTQCCVEIRLDSSVSLSGTNTFTYVNCITPPITSVAALETAVNTNVITEGEINTEALLEGLMATNDPATNLITEVEIDTEAELEALMVANDPGTNLITQTEIDTESELSDILTDWDLFSNSPYEVTLAFGIKPRSASNVMSDQYSVISGGRQNEISGGNLYNTIGGGWNITINSQVATIGGGRENQILGNNSDWSTIGGGYGNILQDGTGLSQGSAIVGGLFNRITASRWSGIMGVSSGITNSDASVSLGLVNMVLNSDESSVMGVGNVVVSNAVNSLVFGSYGYTDKKGTVLFNYENLIASGTHTATGGSRTNLIDSVASFGNLTNKYIYTWNTLSGPGIIGPITFNNATSAYGAVNISPSSLHKSSGVWDFETGDIYKIYDRAGPAATNLFMIKGRRVAIETNNVETGTALSVYGDTHVQGRITSSANQYEFNFNIPAPASWAGDIQYIGRAPTNTAITIIGVHAQTAGTNATNLVYNIEERLKGFWNATGIDIYTSDQLADVTGEDRYSFINANIAAGAGLFMKVISETGTVAGIQGSITFTKDN